MEPVTILIGIAINGEAISGVIHQPYYQYEVNSSCFLFQSSLINFVFGYCFLLLKVGKDPYEVGRTIWAIVGLGVFGIQKIDPPPNCFNLVSTRSHRNRMVNDTLLALKPTTELRVGGAGNKVLHVIEGKAHAYVCPVNACKKWDTCAPQAVLHACGGKMTDIHGEEILYHRDVELANEGGMVAAYSEEMNKSIVKAIPDCVKNELRSLSHKI